jgi:hypothetical protein
MSVHACLCICRPMQGNHGLCVPLQVLPLIPRTTHTQILHWRALTYRNEYCARQHRCYDQRRSECGDHRSVIMRRPQVIKRRPQVPPIKRSPSPALLLLLPTTTAAKQRAMRLDPFRREQRVQIAIVAVRDTARRLIVAPEDLTAWGGGAPAAAATAGGGFGGSAVGFLHGYLGHGSARVPGELFPAHAQTDVERYGEAKRNETKRGERTQNQSRHVCHACKEM